MQLKKKFQTKEMLFEFYTDKESVNVYLKMRMK